MTGYERVKATLEHNEPDKIPFDLGGTMVSGINVIQNGVPPENIMAWWETLQECGSY